MLEHLAERLYAMAGCEMPVKWWGRKSPLVFIDACTASQVVSCWPDKYYFRISVRMCDLPERQLNLGPWELDDARLLVSGAWDGDEVWFPLAAEAGILALAARGAEAGYAPALTTLLCQVGGDANWKGCFMPA